MKSKSYIEDCRREIKYREVRKKKERNRNVIINRNVILGILS